MGRKGSKGPRLDGYLRCEPFYMQFQQFKEAGVLFVLKHHNFWYVGWFLAIANLNGG